jgi:hypothetical protein
MSMRKLFAIVVLLGAGLLALPYVYLGYPNSPIVPIAIIGAAIVSFALLVTGGDRRDHADHPRH